MQMLIGGSNYLEIENSLGIQNSDRFSDLIPTQNPSGIRQPEQESIFNAYAVQTSSTISPPKRKAKDLSDYRTEKTGLSDQKEILGRETESRGSLVGTDLAEMGDAAREGGQAHVIRERGPGGNVRTLKRKLVSFN